MYCSRRPGRPLIQRHHPRDINRSILVSEFKLFYYFPLDSMAARLPVKNCKMLMFIFVVQGSTSWEKSSPFKSWNCWLVSRWLQGRCLKWGVGVSLKRWTCALRSPSLEAKQKYRGSAHPLLSHTHTASSFPLIFSFKTATKTHIRPPPPHHFLSLSLVFLFPPSLF